jgi:hypothetical protein
LLDASAIELVADRDQLAAFEFSHPRLASYAVLLATCRAASSSARRASAAARRAMSCWRAAAQSAVKRGSCASLLIREHS